MFPIITFDGSTTFYKIGDCCPFSRKEMLISEVFITCQILTYLIALQHLSTMPMSTSAAWIPLPRQFRYFSTGQGNRKFPDFENKQTGETLWVANKSTPACVKSQRSSLRSDDDYDSLWQDLFLNPSLWWDHRSRKGNAQLPDFIHKQSGQALWFLRRQTPAWVASKAASLGPAMLQADVISAVERISRYNKARRFEETLQLYSQMQQQGITADCYIFQFVLHAAAAVRDLNVGRRIHEHIIKTGWESRPHISSALVNMYAKCGSIGDARNVFNKMPTRDVVSWNALIAGCVKRGLGPVALELFQQMQQERVEPSPATFVSLLNACASISAIDKGRRVHEMVIRCGYDSDVYIGSSLVDMYAKCGSLEDAVKVFNKMPKRDVVSWTALILGFVKCGQGVEALALFRNMQRDGVEPNPTTFVALLNACASIPALKEGQLVHEMIIQRAYESDTHVGSALVDMYAKCGRIVDALKVFQKMPARNVVSWTAMIVGFVKCGQGLEALELFQQMQAERVEPNRITCVSLLNACASTFALDQGRRVHQMIIRSGYEYNTSVGSALVDMYAKCGSIEDALKEFRKMPTPGLVAWNSMMMGFATHGLAKEAVALFEQMSISGSEMDEVSFICLLSACSHGELVKEGKQYFECMLSVYGVPPTQEHYAIMVDILGRAGHLADAEEMINRMPLEPCASTWRSLLGSCRIHGHEEMGELAFKRVAELDPTHAADYVQL